jgi:hypothetical protein
MTYKLNPMIEKCTSPVTVIFNGLSGNSESNLRKTAECQTWNFEDGKSACEFVFEMKFNVMRFHAENDRVIFEVYEFMEPAKR